MSWGDGERPSFAVDEGFRNVFFFALGSLRHYARVWVV